MPANDSPILLHCLQGGALEDALSAKFELGTAPSSGLQGEYACETPKERTHSVYFFRR